MASVKSRPQRHERSRNEEEEKHDFRNWRSPHHKWNGDRFRQIRQGGRSRDQGENDDQDRHDRAGNHRTRYRYDRESRSHGSSSDRHDRRAEPRRRKPDVFSSTEFPSLGTKPTSKHAHHEKKESDYTPEPLRHSGQRHLSTSSSSSDWASRIEQFEKDKEVAMQDMMKYKRRLLMSESSDGSIDDQDSQKINMDAQPKKEYETDEIVIVRRQKQIAIGKNTLGYDNYVQQVPKHKRVKHKHIFTPNKFQKCSRRAWDGLIKQWRRNLHLYDPEGTYKPENVARKELVFSDTTSEGTSEASSESDVRMDIDLNQSISSAISDYLASNESSRPETPERGRIRPETPTTELKGLTVSDHLNGNYQTAEKDSTSLTSKNDAASTPDATLTPSVTPADHDVEGQNQESTPVVNPIDLIAALRHAAQAVQMPQSYVAPQLHPLICHPHLHGLPPQMTSNFNPQFPAVGLSDTPLLCHSQDNANTKKEAPKKSDIFDNFNLDDCFLKDDEVIA